MNSEFSHINDQGKARMVDIGDKQIQNRLAIAEGKIYLTHETIALIRENQIKKGDVLAVAKIAGILAAKQTSSLIPLCHTILIEQIELDFFLESEAVRIQSTVKSEGKTGAEMEALTAVSIALLTIYDMCKAVDKTMKIAEIKLLRKEKK